LGSYELVSLVGAGAMGEVYRARDTKLGRDVALKTLPTAFALDPDRLARFKREAQLLASLNHPNIAAIYGLEESDAVQALVLELVDGPTLADRIASGPVPLDEALPIARQIAEALEAAHEQGIVHRDLKPANIKVRADGTVKVLDFGLAKALSGAAQGSSPADSRAQGLTVAPTVTSAGMTQAGVILGTAAYMSPEQARGRPADKRADIWAFGCIVYEMLSGRRPFAGETIADVIAAAMTAEPDLTLVPARVQPMVRRCLQKDPKLRLRDVADAMAWVQDVDVAAPDPSAARGWSRWIPYVAASVIVAGAAAVIARTAGRSPEARTPLMRFDLLLPENSGIPTFAVSPDGRFMAMPIVATDGLRHLTLRSIDNGEEHSLPGTENVDASFWSPDGRFIGFTAGGALKKVAAAGGSAEVIAARGVGQRGCWGRDAFIVMNVAGGLSRVPLTGGDATAVTAADSTRGEIHDEQPACLPDGRFLFFRHFAERGASGIYVGDSHAAPDRQRSTPVLVADDGPVLVPGSGTSRVPLLFMRGDTLYVQPLAIDRLDLLDQPVKVADHVASSTGSGEFSASSTGLLVFLEAPNLDRQLTWIDRSGAVGGTVGPISPALRGLKIAHDGTRAAVGMFPPGGLVNNDDIWIMPFDGGAPARLTSDPAVETSPIWSPDDTRVAFASNRGGQWALYEQRIDASEARRILPADKPLVLFDWSPDGRFIMYALQSREAVGEVWVTPASGGVAPTCILQNRFPVSGAKFSPDGRWISYVSTEAGRPQVYVRRFEASAGGTPSSPDDGRVLIASGARGLARWRRDGRELVYVNGNGEMVAVDVASLPKLDSNATRRLFALPTSFLRIAPPGTVGLSDVAPDNSRALFALPTAFRPPALHALVNWQGH
jgi:serine/threonine protein kinase